MKIEHLAIWVQDLEKMRGFYQHYFGMESNELYHNPSKGFSSYFLKLKEGARIELMHQPEITESASKIMFGLAHFAFQLSSEQQVDELTKRFVNDGFTVLDGPRTTGDGYYESVVLDPEGNRLELTA
ncbi:VOC family protein [Vibrio tapetis subsp. quintayensis]|uniref:VOC family protein n=1 Tax=Vibrio tapetis TaxID=52443 RepID=UPI0025B2D294|nr:VOC family protein [Vibrio tapetis]MDN3680841.1 VOC family protein [Vibrio tapetis subsp. quintayensis]